MVLILSARLEYHWRGLSIDSEASVLSGEAWVLLVRLGYNWRGLGTIGEAWVLSARLKHDGKASA